MRSFKGYVGADETYLDLIHSPWVSPSLGWMWSVALPYLGILRGRGLICRKKELCRNLTADGPIPDRVLRFSLLPYIYLLELTFTSIRISTLKTELLI